MERGGKLATIIQTLKDAITNNIICPRTRTDAITLTDNVTRLDNKLAAMDATDTSLGNLISTVSGDLNTHEENTSNPHNVTATQAGALPATGGTLTGQLTIDKSGENKLTIANTVSGNPILQLLAGGVNSAYFYFDRALSYAKIKAGAIDAIAFSTTTGNVQIVNSIESLNGIVLKITSGSGSPEGVVTANVGSLYLRSDGGTTTTLYVKTSGTGNTGWVAK